MKINPVFIIGTHRSGTTWVGNLLASHSDVAAIVHEKHEGIHESAYFSHVYNRYGNLNDKVNYIEFVEAIGSSDYFKLSGITKKELYSLYPANYGEVFRFVMNEFTERQNKRVWIEKSPRHALKLDLIASLFPDALFVATHRNLIDVVRSSLGLNIKYKPTLLNDQPMRKKTIKTTVKNYYFIDKSIKRFKLQNPNKIIICSYDDLIIDSTKVTNELFNFLNLRLEEVHSNYEKNTSFKKGTKNKEELLTKSEINLIKTSAVIMSKLPLLYFNFRLKLIEYLRNNFRIFNNSKLPVWFYRLYDFDEGSIKS